MVHSDSCIVRKPDKHHKVSSGALVTIGVTCFNARDTILRALRCAMAQSWPAVEIIVVDDHSTDGSAEIVRDFIVSDTRARLIRHRENLGVGAARNTILVQARGEFVAFFDDDDESVPHRIHEQVQVVTAHESATGARLVACYAGGDRLYANGYRVDASAIGKQGPILQGPAVADQLLVFRRQPSRFYGAGVPACALLARRSTFEAVGGFDPTQRRLEDVDFAVRLALSGGHFVGTPGKLYVRHMTQGSDKSAEAELQSQIALAEKHRGYLERIGRYHYARHWPRLRYWHFKRRYGRFAVEFLALLLRNPIAVTRHILATGPARLVHEHKMRKRGAA
jgi:glycosyltransferase involved in cell wall biosynthesis